MEEARFVSIDPDRLDAIEPGGPAPTLDPRRHYLEGSREDVAAYLLTLDTINFGSGWFPTLRKRPGCSGYFTVAWALADHWRARGPWDADQLAGLDAAAVAAVLGQDPGHELMERYAEALRELGGFLGTRSSLEVVEAAGGSAEGFAQALADLRSFADAPFFKRAQIAPNDLALAGVAEFDDLDRLTIFADNVVPHVLRVDGALRYAPELAARIDAGELLEAGSPEEMEIRAAAVHAGERLAARLGVAPRILDGWLWNRGQAPRYKAIPRHRARSLYY
jgi:Potential Queuosine, Q, salvage protein family